MFEHIIILLERFRARRCRKMRIIATVCLSVCHTGDPPLNGAIYRSVFSTTRSGKVSSLSAIFNSPSGQGFTSNEGIK